MKAKGNLLLSIICWLVSSKLGISNAASFAFVSSIFCSAFAITLGLFVLANFFCSALTIFLSLASSILSFLVFRARKGFTFLFIMSKRGVVTLLASSLSFSA